MKRKLSLILALCLCVGLTACNSDKPKDAADLMNRAMSVQEEPNYRTEGELTMTVSMEGSGLTFEMPVTMAVDGAVMGDKSYARMDTSTNLMGQEVSTSNRTYIDGNTVYTLSSEDNVWVVSDKDSATEGTNVTGLLEKLGDSSNFEGADMSHEDGAYQVTVSIADIMGEDGLGNLFDFGDLAPSEEASADIEQALGSGELVYVVSEDYYLQSVSLSGVEYSGDYEEEGLSYTAGISMEMSFQFSDYGSVTDADVMVPAEALESSGQVSSDSVSEETVSDEGTSLTGEEDRPAISSAELGDYIGSYNGVSLLPGAYNLTLFEDEFQWDDADSGEYSFFPLTGRANDSVSLYVWDYDDSGLLSGALDAVYSYEFDIIDVSDDNLPDVTFNGLTWGASESEIREAYGEPSYEYASDGYWSVDYDVTSLLNDGIDYELSFSGDEAGVNNVGLRHYQYQ